MAISIHAPRVGCDEKQKSWAKDIMEFQSTHPVWGATTGAKAVKFATLFQSTHPVWGATSSGDMYAFPLKNFNPRTPCGVRRQGAVL